MDNNVGKKTVDGENKNNKTKHKSEVLNNIFPRGKAKAGFIAGDFPQVRR